MLQFDDFKKCYGEILYRWGLRDKRADVLKFASCPPEPHKGIGTDPHFTALHTLTLSGSGPDAVVLVLSPQSSGCTAVTVAVRLVGRSVPSVSASPSSAPSVTWRSAARPTSA